MCDRTLRFLPCIPPNGSVWSHIFHVWSHTEVTALYPPKGSVWSHICHMWSHTEVTALYAPTWQRMITHLSCVITHWGYCPVCPQRAAYDHTSGMYDHTLTLLPCIPQRVVCDQTSVMCDHTLPLLPRIPPKGSVWSHICNVWSKRIDCLVCFCLFSLFGLFYCFCSHVLVFWTTLLQKFHVVYVLPYHNFFVLWRKWRMKNREIFNKF